MEGIRLPENPCGPARPLDAARACVVLFALLAAASAARADDAWCAGGAEAGARVVAAGEAATNVFGVGRSVVVEGRVGQGVMALGGDVIVRGAGRVEGDAAAVGGSVRQCEGSYVGGDVIVVGGAYHHGKSAPGRDPRSKTLMYAGYEQELRELARNPASALTPELSARYLGQRLVAVLFWLVISLALTAVSPGAVGRAAARLQLASPRVALLGLAGAVVLGPGSAAALHLLPSALGVVFFAGAMLLLVMSYVFGRVVIHAATGRWLQRLLLPEKNRSETVALFLGALFWSAALALPYVWPLLVAGLVVTSLGLALSARRRANWKRA